LLDAASGSAHSDIRLGWEVTSVTEHEDFVEVEARERLAAAEHRFTTRWLVGCDGARSAVRRSMGVNYEGDRKKRSYLGGSTVAIYSESDELEQIC
jgi:2-polyprenyl-6-methoxyphenol hydroxylase-like FAD-dependent oxidoreductase